MFGGAFLSGRAVGLATGYDKWVEAACGGKGIVFDHSPEEQRLRTAGFSAAFSFEVGG